MTDEFPIPEAKEAFQNRLEEDLIALMKQKGAPKMTAMPLPGSQRRLSLPLVAAVVSLMLIVGLIVMRNAPPVFQTQPTLEQQSPTSTPFPMVRIVAAARFIEQGQMIEEADVELVQWKEEQTPLTSLMSMNDVVGKYAKTDIYRGSPVLVTIIDTTAPAPTEEHTTVSDAVVIAVQPVQRGQIITAEMVALRLWPVYGIPPRAFRNVEDVIGRVSMTDIYREQPINLMMVSEGHITQVPAGSIDVVIPAERLVMNNLSTFAVGDQVDVVAAILYTDAETAAEPSLTLELIVEGAVITARDETSVTVAVRDATALTTLVAARVPLVLVR